MLQERFTLTFLVCWLTNRPNYTANRLITKLHYDAKPYSLLDRYIEKCVK